MRPSASLVLPILLAACAHRAPPAPPPAVAAARDRVDWDAAGDEAVGWLSAYLAVDTQNPPGDETIGANYLAGILEGEGIRSEIVEYAPGRGSLVARLEGGDEPALCLLHHIDVATVERERWTHAPFSGEIADGMIWGRGALDMKSLGIAEMAAMIWLKRQNIPLKRDIVLLAVSDEEVDNSGIRDLATRWDAIGCSHVVNEGGFGVPGALLEGQTAWPISVAEKGNLWVRMVAHGTPGHGSTPKPDEAPARLVEALEKLADRKAEVDIQPAMFDLLDRAGREKGGLTGSVLRSRGLVRLLVRPKLMGNPLTRATITNTVHPTGFRGELQPNVIPSEVSATLDCRLLPGVQPEELLAELTEIVDDPKIEFQVISAAATVTSPWEDDPLFTALVGNLVDGRDHHFAGPFVSVGSTDSQYLRPLGVRAYGIAPFEVTPELLVGAHGDDERIPEASFRDGIRRFYGAVYEFSAKN